MLSTNYFIHLFFDYDHDIHYTDTMLALESEAYLWYKLRLNHGFDAALFLNYEFGELKIQTFDGFSKQLAEKKGFLDSVLKKSESDWEINGCIQPAKKEFTFEDILKISERKELKNKKIAFVLSMSSLDYLYNNSDDCAVEKIKRKIETPDGKSIMIIKIPPMTSKIREAFLGENAVLPMISRKTVAVLKGAQEPLTDALRRQMKEQIVYGYRIDDAFNMLLKIAAEKGDWTDSLEDMRKQAEYLQLSYNICGKLVLEQRRDSSSSMFIKHRELYEQLKNSDIKQLVRNEIKNLESKYRGFTVGDAMREEKLLPKKELCYPSVLENDDPLVRNIKTLSVSEKFEKCYEYEKWCEQLERIKKNFSTFWNKPLNCLSYSKAEFFCNYVRKACENGDRETFSDALEMLAFCSEQLCAGIDKCENLAVILDYGKSIVELSENVFNILKKYGVEDVNEFKKIYNTYRLSEKNISIEKKLNINLDKENLKRYNGQKEILKNCVGLLIGEIRIHKISDKEMERVRRIIEDKLNAEIETAEKLEGKYSQISEEPEKEPEEYPEEYVEEDIEYIEEDDGDDFPDKLLKKTIYKDM